MTTYTASHHNGAAAMGQPAPGPGRPPVPGPTLHAPPVAGHAHGVNAAGPVAFDPVAASIRNQVVDRVARMSVRHGGHAWRHRRDRPVAPHAVAFLYADPRPDDPRFFTVVAATRMVNDDPSVRDLPRLLYRLATLARERYLPAEGGFDPAVHMTTHRDPASGQAHHTGRVVGRDPGHRLRGRGRAGALLRPAGGQHRDPARPGH